MVSRNRSQVKDHLGSKVLNHPELRNTKATEYMSHEEKYRYNLSRATAMLKLIDEEGMDVNEISKVMSHTVSGFTTPDGNPLAVHQVMFVPTLMNQADDDQVSRWLGDVFNGTIVGTYAQTELSHGTFVRGLRTTATYDPASRTFDLHTPDVSAAKWWPGGLGTTANHAVVMAQLYTDGQPRGIHPFMVAIRDRETHRPLPGITVGEIGPKLGQNTLNNGYLLFDHVKVPRENMLMRNARVNEDGSYTKPSHQKASYGTMVFTRVAIALDTVDALQIAATIAARYSIVRRQGEPRDDGQEPQIIDYQTQQLKVLPHIAACYVLRASTARLWEHHTHVTSEVRGGDTALLPELHATACCLKALVTQDCSEAIEALRLSCGGHGYMTASRLPALYAYATAGATYEGENTVLLLQTARYLVKQAGGSHAPPAAGSAVTYLSRPADDTPFAVGSPAAYVAAVGRVARGRVTEVAAALQADRQTMPEADAWNQSLVQLVAAALAHGRYFVVREFAEVVSQQSSSRAIQQMLQLLFSVYLAHAVSRAEGDFITYGGLTPSDIRLNRRHLLRLLAELRPHMIPLTDAFDLPDRLINSTLGAWDGDVYRRMFEQASHSPLNTDEVPASFHQAMLRSKL
ncbi:putative peroxisomal acyl-coenzyme A oxidase 1 [Amphibalanus amphitrite]|uniref:Acyl-coenzyme A oxidase n=1 Tax=Amphibalanus amphitrite TaxID=1232801 RepID=A0A6A4V7L8_AMPAM|nr:putative peroxisomal acyl-coenzyme A oxidase 1 [Amphibalanus amphitrite]